MEDRVYLGVFWEFEEVVDCSSLLLYQEWSDFDMVQLPYFPIQKCRIPARTHWMVPMVWPAAS